MWHKFLDFLLAIKKAKDVKRRKSELMPGLTDAQFIIIKEALEKWHEREMTNAVNNEDKLDANSVLIRLLTANPSNLKNYEKLFAVTDVNHISVRLRIMYAYLSLRLGYECVNNIRKSFVQMQLANKHDIDTVDKLIDTHPYVIYTPLITELFTDVVFSLK